MLSEHFFVLHMPDHGNVALETQLYGGGMHYRYLNVTGRWSARGTKIVPLLAWRSHESAKKAAQKASDARQREISVSSLMSSRDLSETMQYFSDTAAPALIGYLPYKATAAAKVEADRLKTMRYAAVLWRVCETEEEESEETIKQCNKELHEFCGGGSITSAVQFFTGKKAAQVIEGLLDGELEFSEGVSLSTIAAALAFANSWKQRDYISKMVEVNQP